MFSLFLALGRHSGNVSEDTSGTILEAVCSSDEHFRWIFLVIVAVASLVAAIVVISAVMEEKSMKRLDKLVKDSCKEQLMRKTPATFVDSVRNTAFVYDTVHADVMEFVRADGVEFSLVQKNCTSVDVVLIAHGNLSDWMCWNKKQLIIE